MRARYAPLRRLLCIAALNEASSKFLKASYRMIQVYRTSCAAYGSHPAWQRAYQTLHAANQLLLFKLLLSTSTGATPTPRTRHDKHKQMNETTMIVTPGSLVPVGSEPDASQLRLVRQEVCQLRADLGLDDVGPAPAPRPAPYRPAHRCPRCSSDRARGAAPCRYPARKRGARCRRS